jgi:hypothetical protein
MERLGAVAGETIAPLGGTNLNRRFRENENWEQSSGL